MCVCVMYVYVCVCVRACARANWKDRRSERPKVQRSFRRLSERDSRYVRCTNRAQLLVRGYGVGVSVSRARPQKSVYVRACVPACVRGSTEPSALQAPSITRRRYKHGILSVQRFAKNSSELDRIRKRKR